MADFGTDIGGATDLDPSFGVVTGPKVLGLALARRLTTPRGALPYAPDFGLDVRLWLNDANNQSSLQALRAAIAQELEGDERVLAATASVSYDSLTQALGIVAQVDTADGPFSLTLAITATTVAILNGA